MVVGESPRKKRDGGWRGVQREETAVGRQQELVSQGALKGRVGQSLESKEAAGDRAKSWAGPCCVLRVTGADLGFHPKRCYKSSKRIGSDLHF